MAGTFSDAFVHKWQDRVNFGPNNGLPLSSKEQGKTYHRFLDLELDIKEHFSWTNILNRIILVWLHDCGGITRVEITKESIRYSEPAEWDKTEQVTHYECRGCSDVDRITN